MCFLYEPKLIRFVNTTHSTYPALKNSDAIVDSGASNYTLHTEAPVNERTPTIVPRHCGTPTGHSMASTEHGLIPHNLPRPAREGHLYPSLSYCSLVSIGQICDSGYTT